MTPLLGWDLKGPTILRQMGLLADDSESTDPELWARQEERPQEFQHPTGIDLVVRTIVTQTMGRDRRHEDDGTEINVTWLRLTIQVYAECQEDTDTLSAHVVLTNIGGRLARESAKDAFRAAGLALLSPPGNILPVQAVDEDGRRISAMTMDVSFNTVLEDRDLTTVGNWIERVHVQGSFRHAPEEEAIHAEEPGGPTYQEDLS